MPRTRVFVAASLAFAITFVFNPGYFAGCAASDEPDFGEQEMLTVLAAANAMGPWEFEADGARYEAELTLAQKPGDDADLAARATPFSTRARACGTRTFMQSAAACVTESVVPLQAVLSLRRVDQEPAVELASELAFDGDLTVFGLEIDNAYIHLESGSHSIDLRASDGRNFELIGFHAAQLGTMYLDIHYDPES